jgi:hypothetical protein
MFKRLFWLCVGIGLGAGMAYWLQKFVRQTAERYSPERMSNELVDGARKLGTDLRKALDEGREAMRKREAELRADLELRQAR